MFRLRHIVIIYSVICICLTKKCQRYYTSYTCQHADIDWLESKARSTFPSQLKDADDSTCVDSSFGGSIGYSIQHAVLFIWVYIYRASIGDMRPILKLFSNSNEIGINPYYLRVDKHALLIKLDQIVSYDELKLTNLPNDTCTVDFSLGRNLAPSGTARMSTVHTYWANWRNLTPAEVVRRTIHNVYYGQCRIATDAIPDQWWKVALREEAIISIVSIEIYRNDRCVYQHINLRTTTLNGDVAFNKSSKNYRIWKYAIFVGDDVPVKEVVLSVHKNDIRKTHCPDNVHNVLELCKVRIFGEFQCPDGQYGLLCEVSCPGCRRKVCDPDWGCLDGCTEGWALEGSWCSLDCRKRYGGPDRCKFDCSAYCAGAGYCDRNSGSCLEGCSPGYHENNCTKPCLLGSFGQNCSKFCVNCQKDNVTNLLACDHVTGECLIGCAEGYEGELCQEKRNKRGDWFFGFFLPNLEYIIPAIITALLVLIYCIYIHGKHGKPQAADPLNVNEPLDSLPNSPRTVSPNQAVIDPNNRPLHDTVNDPILIDSTNEAQVDAYNQRSLLNSPKQPSSPLNSTKQPSSPLNSTKQPSSPLNSTKAPSTKPPKKDNVGLEILPSAGKTLGGQTLNGPTSGGITSAGLSNDVASSETPPKKGWFF